MQLYLVRHGETESNKNSVDHLETGLEEELPDGI